MEVIYRQIFTHQGKGNTQNSAKAFAIYLVYKFSTI